MPQLTEANRAKLDGIVRQMSDNGEPDDAIRFVVSDFKTKYALPDRPVSAEDFTKPEPSRGWPAKLGDVALGLGKSIVGGGWETAKAISDLQRGTMGGDMEALDRTTQRVKGIGAASADQFRKAVAAPTTSEFVGHALSSIPVVGPPIGQAGEKIAAGDWEGLGEGIGLVAAPFAPKMLPAVGRGAAAVGRGAQAVGRNVGPVASMALEAAPQIAADTALSYMTGHPAPIMTAAKVAQAVAGKVREGRAAKAANAGGTLVREKAPTLPQVLSEALDEAAQAPPPARVTTPPPAGLPPGYTPRTTAPKPKLKPAPAATRKRPASPEMGPKGYFLRKPEPVAAMEPVEAVPMTEASLPTSWRGRTNQPIVSPNSATGKQWAAQFAEELQARGLSAEDAIVLVSKNPDLPPMVRLQIVSALKQVK